MSQQSKITRTQITDLPETAVELTEQEMSLVSGGLRAKIYGCNSRMMLTQASVYGGGTNVVTGQGDWDTD